MSQNKTMLAITIGLIFWSPLSWSQKSGSSGSSGSSRGGLMQRATARETKRWTLQEWMNQKNNNALMNQWLVWNSPSPFEFLIGGGMLDYKTRIDSPSSETNYTSSSGELAAYAQSVGLSVDYENNLKEHYNETTGLLNIRILGNSLQSTSITIAAGQRTRNLTSTTPSLELRNTTAQIHLQSYFTKYFGIDGFYRHYFPADQSTLGQVSGNRSEAGLFIDYKILRIYGAWVQDIEIDKSTTSIETTTTRTGLKSGIKIFF